MSNIENSFLQSPVPLYGKEVVVVVLKKASRRNGSRKAVGWAGLVEQYVEEEAQARQSVSWQTLTYLSGSFVL